MRKKFSFALLVTFLAFATRAQQPVSKLQQVFTIEKNIGLQTDVYYQDTLASYPVILMRTPYPRRQYGSVATYFCKLGYIVVIQSVRGTDGSGGQMIPFINETGDGLAMLDLLTAKKWCNGSIGLYGASYSSFCGLTLGTTSHPSLKAIVNINGWVEPALTARPAGVNHLMMNIPWMLFNYSGGKLVPGKYNADSLLSSLPENDMLKGFGIDITSAQMLKILDGLNKNMDYKNFNVPVLHVTGMYDFTKEGTFNIYDSLRKYKKQQRFIIGPWVHDQIFSGSSRVGDWELPKQGYDSLGSGILNAAANWFRLYLKNDPTASTRNAFQAMPVFADSFNINEKEYPGEEMKSIQLFLLPGIENQGHLDKKTSATNSHKSFLSDPYKPVPTNGGANFHLFKQNIGLKDQTEIEKRKDVLTFSAEKINGQFWGLGKAKVKLFVSFAGKDCDFTAKLVAVDNNNKAWNISDGITRMSSAARPGKNTGMKDADGNIIWEIEIDMGHIVFQLTQGWSFRLEIAGSNFPKYDRNPGTGEDPMTATKLNPVLQTIHFGKKFPSVLEIGRID